MTHVPSDPLVGHVLEGRYVIEARVARGGMAVVYQGTDQRLHRKVAIKVMHQHLADDLEFKKRFEQEALNAAKLTHPNLVGVLDQGEENGIVFLIMEYIPGITLRDLLRQQHFLTTSQTLEISEAILQGLAAAHQAGIIHRDLKPENVLLADDGRVKLGDFGLARAAGSNTATGQALLGTIAYLSPELVTRGIADKQSDIYAFGIMLYEMLTGAQPFTGEQPMQVAYQHAHEPIPLPSAASKTSTPWLDEIVKWSTQKDPADRPADANELLRAIKRQTPAATQQTAVLATEAISGVDPATTVFAPVTTVPVEKIKQRPVEKAHRKAKKRRVRGYIIFLLSLMVASGALATSWWFFLGPGADIAVPSLIGSKTADAQSALSAIGLKNKVEECSDREIAPGHIVSTSPNSGSRVKRDSVITLCESSGPAIVATPDLAGLTVEEAEQEIESAGFTFGSVTAWQFSAEARGSVLYAVTQDGDPLPENLPELSIISIVASAGELPKVVGLKVAEAEEKIIAADLLLDSDSIVYDYSDDYAEDTVIGLLLLTDPAFTGSAVTLHVSMGPELFAVPSVEGLTIREAMTVINEHGFEAKAPWYLNEAALDSFKAKGTSPAYGELLPLGSAVEVTPKIF